MQVLRTIYRYATIVLFFGILAQIGAAGYGAFYVANKLDDKGDTLGHEGFEHGWDFHTGFGYIVAYAGILFFLLALVARIGRPRIWFALATAVVLIVQVVLAWLGEAVPGVGFLHPLNALVVFVLSGFVAHRNWRGVPARPAPAA